MTDSPTTETQRSVVVGLFVGGRGTRMGGVAKGQIEAPDRSGSIFDRLVSVVRALGLEVVLAGRHEAYASSELVVLDDAVSSAGPLGGLVSLLAYAGARDAIAIATDLPFVEAALLARLTREQPAAHVLAPRCDGFWEPLFARYRSERVIDAARARLASRQLALQGLLDAVGATELVLSDAERATLIDWDTPDDVARCVFC